MPRNRLGKVKRILHRRQTPLKTKQPIIPDIKKKKKQTELATHPGMVNTSIDIHAAINSIQSDLTSIKLDGSRLGEAVLDMQKEVVKIRNEMVTKEVFEVNLTQLIKGVNVQLAQLAEIDHNRGKILETEERVETIKARLENQHTTLIDQKTRLENIEATVITDLNSFRKELYGFEERLTKVSPPTPFLPTKQSDSQSAGNSQIVSPPPKVSPQNHDNKSIIIEGLNEHPLEDLEGKVREMLQDIGISLQDSDYDKMERLGKWNTNRTWPRPIKVELTTSHKKAKILANREYLGQTNDYYRVRLNQDEAREVRVARAIVRQTANKARSEGKVVQQTPRFSDNRRCTT